MSVSDPDVDAEHFRVELRSFSAGLILALSGEFDLAGVPCFDRAFETAFESDVACLVLDFSELGFIDSSGISAIVSAMTGLQRVGRQLQVCGIEGQVARVLSLVGIRDHLPVVDRPASTAACR